MTKDLSTGLVTSKMNVPKGLGKQPPIYIDIRLEKIMLGLSLHLSLNDDASGSDGYIYLNLRDKPLASYKLRYSKPLNYDNEGIVIEAKLIGQINDQIGDENHSEYILSLLASKLSVLPITEGCIEAPYLCLSDTDKKLLTERAKPEQVWDWINNGAKAWAVAGGEVSGNLVALDFNERSYPGLYDLWYAKLDNEMQNIINLSYLSRTPDGFRLIYQTESPQPTITVARKWVFNKKTGQREVATLAETQGEGSYALVSPSAGYTTVQGYLPNIEMIPDDFHEELLEALRSFGDVTDEEALAEVSPNQGKLFE